MKIKKPYFWNYRGTSFWSILLYPISLLYLLIILVRRISTIFKTYKKPNIPVVCVGNIYLGGTGKTPLAREIFNITKSLGKNPAFVKKDYEYLYDEIQMLKDTGKTYACKNRQLGISLSIKDNHDLAILDDGFQDLSIKPDFSILCFNSKQMIGNGFVIPSGPLRERLNSIIRADCIIINGQKDFEFEKKISEYEKTNNKKLHIFYSKYKIRNLEKFKNKEITAFAGIGNPTNFFELLKENNLNVKNTFSFPDHHYYSQKDFEKIKKDETTQIITTEKDYYRMNEIQKQSCEYIKVDLEINDKNKFVEIIKSFL